MPRVITEYPWLDPRHISGDEPELQELEQPDALMSHPATQRYVRPPSLEEWRQQRHLLSSRMDTPTS